MMWGFGGCVYVSVCVLGLRLDFIIFIIIYGGGSGSGFSGC